LLKGRTSFIIAHRLSTVRHADLVVVLDQGKLVEVGKPAELLALGGAYARLHREQFEERPAEVLDLASKRANR
jgi:subfamily B ATP-binding cassette protein MsbA